MTTNHTLAMLALESILTVAKSKKLERRPLSQIHAQQRQDLAETDFMELQEEAELGVLAQRQQARAGKAMRIPKFRAER